MNFDHYRHASVVQCSYYGAVASLLALIALCIAWEGLLAPVKSNGSWLTLKALPLLLPLLGILRGKRYTYQWSTMLIWLYFIEGVLRAWSDKGLAQQLAWAEIVLSLLFFVCTMLYAKFTGASQTVAVTT
jgi:uncharacterized membrane protein